MSSNLFSTVQNYSGRQPDNVQNIKQFVTQIPSSIPWVLKQSENIPNKQVMTPANSSNYPVYINNSIYLTGNVYQVSDVNVKQNISEINESDCINLFNVTPVKYNLKNTQDDPSHFGFIAQNVESNYPQLVSEQNDLKTVNYTGFIPIMLKQMDIMNKQIISLNQQINALNDQIDSFTKK